MAFNKIRDQVRAHLTDIFLPDVSSPPSKQPRGDNADTNDHGKRNANPGKIPFGKSEARWLQTALTDTFGVFGEHVENRLQVVEDKVSKSEEQVGTLCEEDRNLKDELQAVKGSIQQSKVPLDRSAGHPPTSSGRFPSSFGSGSKSCSARSTHGAENICQDWKFGM